jgi:transposase
MTNYREILRLNSLGIHKQDIAKACGCSRNTVASVLKKARNKGIGWEAVQAFAHTELAERLFPGGPTQSVYRMPDYEYIHREMAKHYGTAVLPARVRSPKDKASVEGSVGVISTWIIAALRNEQFLSLWELREMRSISTAIRTKLTEFNAKPFQKKEGKPEECFRGRAGFPASLAGTPLRTGGMEDRKPPAPAWPARAIQHL